MQIQREVGRDPIQWRGQGGWAAPLAPLSQHPRLAQARVAAGQEAHGAVDLVGEGPHLKPTGLAPDPQVGPAVLIGNPYIPEA